MVCYVAFYFFKKRNNKNNGKRRVLKRRQQFRIIKYNANDVIVTYVSYRIWKLLLSFKNKVLKRRIGFIVKLLKEIFYDTQFLFKKKNEEATQRVRNIGESERHR